MPRSWWSFVIRGTIAGVILIVLVVNPLSAKTSVINYLGFFFFANGLFSLNIARNVIQTRASSAMALLSLIGGLMVVLDSFLRPDADTRYFVGALAVAVGALQISGQVHISSHKLRQITRSNLLLGGLQIIFGLCLIFLPTSLITLWAARLWMLATVAVMYWNAYRLRRLWQVIKAPEDHR
jgi:uncharacterized membrane protein HdeD (DUF308 family)